MKKIIILSSIHFTLVSCIKKTSNNLGATSGYKPVYLSLTDLNNITVLPAQNTIKAGKIYAYGNYVFQNDVNKGIHIIDNSISSNPQKKAFLQIPYSSEIAIKGNYLYTNSVSDLLVFNLSNPLQPVLVNRIKNAFPIINQAYPLLTNVYFECPDATKGIVVDWELGTINNPNCQR